MTVKSKLSVVEQMESMAQNILLRPVLCVLLPDS